MPTDLPSRPVPRLTPGGRIILAGSILFLVLVGFLLGLMAAGSGLSLQSPIRRDAPATQR